MSHALIRHPWLLLTSEVEERHDKAGLVHSLHSALRPAFVDFAAGLASHVLCGRIAWRASPYSGSWLLSGLGEAPPQTLTM